MYARSMSAKRGLVLGLGLLSAATAAWMVHNMVGARQTASVAPVQMIKQIPAEIVLVASNDIQFGKALTAQDFVWQTWPVGGTSASMILQSRRDCQTDRFGSEGGLPQRRADNRSKAGKRT